jgi:hypothetical protein
VTAVRTAQARRYPSVIYDRFQEGTSMHRLTAAGRYVELSITAIVLNRFAVVGKFGPAGS